MVFTDYLFYPLIYFGFVDNSKTKEHKRQKTLELLNNKDFTELEKVIKILNNKKEYFYTKEMIKEQLQQSREIILTMFKNNPSMLFIFNHLEAVILYSQI